MNVFCSWFAVIQVLPVCSDSSSSCWRYAVMTCDAACPSGRRTWMPALVSYYSIQAINCVSGQTKKKSLVGFSGLCLAVVGALITWRPVSALLCNKARLTKEVKGCGVPPTTTTLQAPLCSHGEGMKAFLKVLRLCPVARGFAWCIPSRSPAVQNKLFRKVPGAIKPVSAVIHLSLCPSKQTKHWNTTNQNQQNLFSLPAPSTTPPAPLPWS